MTRKIDPRLLEEVKRDPRKLQALAKTAKQRQERSRRLDADAVLFGPQNRFIRDPAKLKAAVCSRRAGKSHGLAFQMVEWAMAHDMSIVPYITLTRDNAKNIIWPAIASVCKNAGIEIETKANTGDILFPHNKSKIILRGCDDRNQIEKLRGPKYPGAVIDEAQGFGSYILELIEDVLEPATMDYDGQILVTGTPNAVCAGPFHDICTGIQKGWSVHTWTMRENPHLPDPEGWLKRKMEQKGWGFDNPTYLREYCGLWVQDSDSLVYSVKPFNLVDTPELEAARDWSYGLGIDVGFNDPTAFCVVAYSESLGLVKVLESYQEAELLPVDVASHVRELESRYGFEFIVVDSGGIGKPYLESLKREHHIGAKHAQKTEKAAAIGALNSDLASARIQIVHSANQDLVEQMKMLQWEEKSRLRNQPKEDRRTPNHICDAFLYAHRECMHHMPEWEENDPPPGTDAYWQKIEEEMEEADEAAYEAAHSSEWWESL